MKYGKEFQQILNDSSFPEEWKSSAIEYSQLKKLIKDVVVELSSMGLSPDVLHKLLVTEEETPSHPSITPSHHWQSIKPSPLPVSESTKDESIVGDDGDILEFEFESDEGTPPTLVAGSVPKVVENGHHPQEVILDPVDSDEEVAKPFETEEMSASLPTPTNTSAHPHHRKFRLRLLSESQTHPVQIAKYAQAGPSIKPIGPGDMMRSYSEDGDCIGESSSHPRSHSMDSRHGRRRRVVKKAVSSEHGGVKAEYELVGDSTHPVPQIRLTLSTSPKPDHLLPVSPISRDSESEVTSEDDDRLPHPQLIARSSLEKTPRALRTSSPRMVPEIDVIPPSPTLERLRTAVSPIWAIASGGDVDDGMHKLSLGEAAVETVSDPVQIEDMPSISATSSSPGREFIIPLASDMAFFNLLTAALTSLSTFHAAQQAEFHRSVATLCRMISSSIQPQPNLEILPTPLTPSTALTNQSAPRLIHTSSKASKKDLYAWREIFTLWIEAQIFESSSERDRGERSVEQAEVRLKAFANQVVKRGLGDRRTLKGKKTRVAWEEFLRLNVLLLDLKRFQSANINAARKILKKHDKRTALTASAGFPSFVRSTLAAHVDKDGNVSTWTFYNTSLPHVLLASLTDTLLPILPSLDDYACLICTSIAFKPIRLGCGHLFCVRCLVKMQKAGSAECPLCRSPTVLLADKSSLDYAVMNFMKEWFPKEVKLKQRENDQEVVKEHATEAGIKTDCTIM